MVLKYVNYYWKTQQVWSNLLLFQSCQDNLKENFKDPLSNPSILHFHIPCKLPAMQLRTLIVEKRRRREQNTKDFLLLSASKVSFSEGASSSSALPKSFGNIHPLHFFLPFFSKELTKSLWSLQAAAEQNTYPSPSLANYLSNFLKGNLIDALSKTTFFQGRSLICKMEFQSLGLTVLI